MLEINNVGVDKILENITLEIKGGYVTSIIGKNGAGKSTLARAIASLIDYSGEVKHEGEIAFVFQNPDVQFVRSLVEDDIAFGLENIAITPENMKLKIEKITRQFGIYDLLNKSVHKLSGGQKQKVAIVANLILEPKILILDEAFEMLDMRTKEDILNILKVYVKENNIILINITHDNKVLEYSDYIIGIDEGKVDFTLTREDFYKDERLMNKYKIKLPFYIYLKKELNRNNIELNINMECEEDLKGLL